MTQSQNPFVPKPSQVGEGKVTHVAIVLDRSGSMEACRDATISGFNEYIEHIRTTAGKENLEVKVTLTVFNHEVSTRHLGAPLPKLRPIDRESYVPDGNTAMLDALGITVDRLRKDVAPAVDTEFVVCVISDGYENASRRYTYPQIAETIQQLTATDRWTFTYIGSNQDLSQVSAQLNIPVGNMMAYQPTQEGTSGAWERHSRATSRRMSAAPQQSRAAEFYDEDERSER